MTPHDPRRSVASDDPVLQLERSAVFDGLPDRAVHAVSVLRVYESQECFVAGSKGVLLDPEDPVQLVRPRNAICLDVPLPASDTRDPLRVGELELSLAKSVFGALAPDQGAELTRNRTKTLDQLLVPGVALAQEELQYRNHRVAGEHRHCDR